MLEDDVITRPGYVNSIKKVSVSIREALFDKRLVRTNHKGKMNLIYCFKINM